VLPAIRQKWHPSAYEQNRTELEFANWSSEHMFSNVSVHSAWTDWAPTVLVSLQPIKSWRWRAWPICSWVDLLQIGSVRFSLFHVLWTRFTDSYCVRPTVVKSFRPRPQKKCKKAYRFGVCPSVRLSRCSTFAVCGLQIAVTAADAKCCRYTYFMFPGVLKNHGLFCQNIYFWVISFHARPSDQVLTTNRLCCSRNY